MSQFDEDSERLDLSEQPLEEDPSPRFQKPGWARPLGPMRPARPAEETNAPQSFVAAALSLADVRDRDHRMLRALVETDLSNGQHAAFSDMLYAVEEEGEVLTPKQRKWAEEVCYSKGLYDEMRTGAEIRREVPRGREVETPAVLRDLPKKPPGRR